MDFLDKLNFLLQRENLNKNSFSKQSGIPYTTIDGWYKKGYESMQLSTLKKLSKFFNTTLDFWAQDDASPNRANTNSFTIEPSEIGFLKKFRTLDTYGKKAVNSLLEIEYSRCLDIPPEEVKDNHLNKVAARNGNLDRLPDSELIDSDIKNADEDDFL